MLRREQPILPVAISAAAFFAARHKEDRSDHKTAGYPVSGLIAKRGHVLSSVQGRGSPPGYKYKWQVE